jgi:hypothetical protein
MPDPATVLEGVFCEGEAEVLENGLAPWSGFGDGGGGDGAGGGDAEGGAR